VHYSTDFDNAFRNGRQMVYGDGAGEIFGRFTSSLDISRTASRNTAPISTTRGNPARSIASAPQRDVRAIRRNDDRERRPPRRERKIHRTRRLARCRRDADSSCVNTAGHAASAVT